MVSGCFSFFLGVIVVVWVAVVTAVGGAVVAVASACVAAPVAVFLGEAIEGVASIDLV